jgi:steroid delta-isomerase-like uncharacterized protein
MSHHDHVAFIHNWFEQVWNQQRLEVVHELCAPNAIGTGQHGGDSEISNPDEFVAFAKRFQGAFPDARFKIEDAFSVGDKVVARWSGDMTHKGNDLGLPATNRKAHITGTTILQLENGKIVRGWDHWDQLALLRQLGIAPESQESQLQWVDPKGSARTANQAAG